VALGQPGRLALSAAGVIEQQLGIPLRPFHEIGSIKFRRFHK
jgi:hypothetical protein